MRLLLKEKNFSKISIRFQKKNILRFLSLRYGADFRRSRLVSDNAVGKWNEGTFKSS